jgi:hypothetical protein
MIENFRVVEDDVDAAVPVDAKSAPTRDLENCTHRSFPQRPHRSSSFGEREEGERETKSHSRNRPPNRIRSNVWELATVLPMSPVYSVTYAGGRTLGVHRVKFIARYFQKQPFIALCARASINRKTDSRRRSGVRTLPLTPFTRFWSFSLYTFREFLRPRFAIPLLKGLFRNLAFDKELGEFPALGLALKRHD